MIEKLKFWVVWHLPKWVIVLSAARLGAHATTGKYSHTYVPALTLIDAMNRWTHDTD